MAKKNETNHTMTDIEESYLLLVKHGLNPEPMGKVPFYDSGVPCGIPTDLGDLQDHCHQVFLLFLSYVHKRKLN